MSLTTKPVLADTNQSATHRRRLRQLAQTGIIVTALSAGVWLRHELLQINDIDLAAVCLAPDELPEESMLPARPGRLPRTIYPRWSFRHDFTREFEERRDRFAGMLVEPRRRASCRDAAREAAWDAGGRSCEAQFAELSRRYGAPRVRWALQWRYGSTEQLAKIYLLNSIAVLILVASAASGSAFVRVTIKAINRSTSLSDRQLHESHVHES
jgi:hypothetical protein